MSSTVLPAYASTALERAAEVLRQGGLVIVPTDTVYGVAAALDRPEAVARIYEAKGRMPEKPIALLVDRIEDVEAVALEIPTTARILMERFWPGGLTIVLPRRAEVPDIVAAGGPTIAVRMPDHIVPRALVRRLGRPLPTTSANRSGERSPRTVEESVAALGDRVMIALDAGPAPGGIDSTVIDVTTSPPAVVRVGAVSIADLESALGGVVARSS